MTGFTEEISKFFEATSSLIAEVRNFSEDGLRASFYKERLQVHIEICSVILTHLNMQQQPSAMMVYNELVDLANQLSVPSELPNDYDNTSRHPMSIGLTLEQLEFLRRMRYSWKQIASMMNVSLSTITRRRTELGFVDGNVGYSSLTDKELDDIIRDLRKTLPYCGEKYLRGALRAKGLKVQILRIRQSIKRVDPMQTAMRHVLVTYRRNYNVPGPNALWHIDSNHKIIRWRFIIHGCIDGYSRLIIYLRCATDNKSITVLDMFSAGVTEWSLPSRVRADHGTENVLVAQFMLEQRGIDHASFITGSSVHNSRIERLWRDSNRCVSLYFARLFTYMEMSNILDPLNEIHIFCLHFIFLSRINYHLSSFRSTFNEHPLSTENGQSPLQLWVTGNLENQGRDQPGVDSVFNGTVDHNYGVDLEGPIASLETSNNVQVPETSILLNQTQMEWLKTEVNVSSNDNNYGITLYMRAVDTVLRIINSH